MTKKSAEDLVRRMTKPEGVRRSLENALVVWLDDNIDEAAHEYQHSISQLQHMVNEVKIFTFIDDCVDYLNSIQDETVFLIVSGSLGQEVVPAIQDISRVDTIYIFSSHEAAQRSWIEDYPKIKGLFTQIEPLCSRLRQDVYKTDNNQTLLSIIPPSCSLELNQMDSSFMYSQLLKEVLLETNSNDKEIGEFIRFCREQSADNRSRLSILEEFEHNYRPTLSIRWYTRDCFIYPMLNRALRMQEIDVILKMGFFIRDLHRQIEHVRSNASHLQPFTIYRGQGMNRLDFERLCKNKGGLLSFNNFLSTTFDRQVGYLYADCAQRNPDMTGVLFRIDLDPSTTTAPFASLHDLSHFVGTEEEILFSMHTVFRIGESDQLENRLWEVKLTLTNDNDEDLKNLTNFLREETDDKSEWNRLVGLLLKMGEYSRAEEIYTAMSLPSLDIDTTNDRAFQSTMGFIMSRKGKKKSAVTFYQSALRLQENFPRSDEVLLARLHSNIGEALFELGEFTTALDHLNRARLSQEQLLAGDHPSLGHTYNNIGNVYTLMGEYSNALLYMKKALVIAQGYLPPNHPDLGVEQNNIGYL